MEVILNDKPYTVEENTTLAAFVESLKLKPEGIAIAVNYNVVPKDQWAKTILTDKMELMLIHAVSGG
jgi:sulfur carrier protein